MACKPACTPAIRACKNLDDNGDLKFSTDYRQVFSAVLQDHLGADPAPILAGSYDPVRVIRA